MQVDRVSHFLLHPFEPTHTKWQTFLSIISNIALSILTCGAYLAIWGIVRYHETPGKDYPRHIVVQHPKRAYDPGAPFSPR